MEIIDKTAFLEKKSFFLEEIKAGKIFIYPTDTIYGIGCSALNPQSVSKIRQIKQREEKPFSVIAPNKSWILDNCIVTEKEELNKLPGPFTLILNIKNKDAIAQETNNSLPSLGVRIPDNWFSKIIEESGIPFITTSVNISGQPHIKSPSELSKEISSKVDYIIDSGSLTGSPSTIINLTKSEEKIIKR